MADESRRPPQASGGSDGAPLPAPARSFAAGRIDVLCERLEQAERRLQEMADGYQAVFENLSEVDRKHASTVATLNERLGDWCDLERKLLEESARRIERFERGIGHEWTVLRRMHEESIQSVHDQASEIRRLFGETAGAVQVRLEAAEGEYASRATALEQQMRDWVRRLFEVGRATGALEADAGAPEPGAAVERNGAAPVQPWSLEGVAQLHQEMRSGGPGADPPRPAPDAAAAGDPKGAATPTDPGSRPGQDAIAAYRGGGYGPSRARRMVLAWVAAIAGIGLVLTFFIYASYLRSRINELDVRSRDAARQADDERERLRTAAEQQWQAASRSEALVQILAAPDLYRLPLAGLEPAPDAFGQALWSRSRGVAVTASRLPPAPDGKIYRVWAMGTASVTGLGLLTPDADGRATLVTTAAPAGTLRPLWIVITLEDSPDGAQPTGKRFLASPQGLSGGSDVP